MDNTKLVRSIDHDNHLGDRVDDPPAHLGAAGAVEKDRRLAVYLLRERGKLRANPA